MSGSRFIFLSRSIHISLQRLTDFITKVNEGLITAFADNPDSTVIKIHILQIQSYTLRNSNTCSQKQRQNCHIPNLCFLMRCQLTPG